MNWKTNIMREDIPLSPLKSKVLFSVISYTYEDSFGMLRVIEERVRTKRTGTFKTACKVCPSGSGIISIETVYHYKEENAPILLKEFRVCLGKFVFLDRTVDYATEEEARKAYLLKYPDIQEKHLIAETLKD